MGALTILLPKLGCGTGGDSSPETRLYILYKMHGSIRWERDVAGGGIVRLVDNDPETPDLIFGTDYKLQYIDPYLFYAYEFRQYSLDASVILTIGYSFRDEHINGILAQALHNDPKRRIVVVTPDPELEISRFCEVNQDLKSKLVACRAGAKEFLSSVSVTKIEGLLREPITGGPAERF